MILRLATQAMATRFELALEGEVESWLRAVGEEALEEVHDAERRLSRFARGSLLSLVNDSAARGPVAVDPETYALLETCAEVQRASRGAFDPTVAPLMEAYGFHPPRDSARSLRGGAADPAAAVAEGRVGWQHVRLDAEPCTVRFLRAGLALDLGAIGKGHALDLAAAVLREHGIERALLHGGTSTALAIGAPPGAAGWRIALGPGAPRAHLCDAALSVSAQHGRTVERDGARLGHVLDPCTGRPAAGRAAAAVIHRSAALADAWSTALLAGSPESSLSAQNPAAWLPRGASCWRVRPGAASGAGRFEFPQPLPQELFA